MKSERTIREELIFNLKELIEKRDRGKQDSNLSAKIMTLRWVLNEKRTFDKKTRRFVK